jgi:hypothetical protein
MTATEMMNLVAGFLGQKKGAEAILSHTMLYYYYY